MSKSCTYVTNWSARTESQKSSTKARLARRVRSAAAFRSAGAPSPTSCAIAFSLARSGTRTKYGNSRRLWKENYSRLPITRSRKIGSFERTLLPALTVSAFAAFEGAHLVRHCRTRRPRHDDQIHAPAPSGPFPTGDFNSSVSPWLAVGLVEQRNWVRFAKTSRPALSASALPASEGARLVHHRSRR